MASAKIDTKKYNQVSVNGLRMFIRMCHATDIPLLVYGPPGGGKSSIIAQESAEAGRHLIDGVRLSQVMPEDIGGAIAPDMERRVAERLMPDIVKACWDVYNSTGKKIDLFLDEINHAMLSVLSACYQLVLERRAAGFELPPDTRIFAAGNFGSGTEMPEALSNRFAIVEFGGPTWDEWRSYAVDQNLHPDLLGFLSENSDWLNNRRDPRAIEGRQPTPRAFEFLSEMFYYADDAGLSDADKIAMASSVVGDPCAAQMIASISNAHKLHPFEKVVKDPEGVEIYPDELGVCYMQMMRLIVKVSTKQEMDACVTFMERLPKLLMGPFLRTLMHTKGKANLVIANLPLIKKYREYTSAGVRTHQN